jgi:hypothetical protein
LAGFSAVDKIVHTLRVFDSTDGLHALGNFVLHRTSFCPSVPYDGKLAPSQLRASKLQLLAILMFSPVPAIYPLFEVLIPLVSKAFLQDKEILKTTMFDPIYHSGSARATIRLHTPRVVRRVTRYFFSRC